MSRQMPLRFQKAFQQPHRRIRQVDLVFGTGTEGAHIRSCRGARRGGNPTAAPDVRVEERLAALEREAAATPAKEAALASDADAALAARVAELEAEAAASLAERQASLAAQAEAAVAEKQAAVAAEAQAALTAREAALRAEADAAFAAREAALREEIQRALVAREAVLKADLEAMPGGKRICAQGTDGSRSDGARGGSGGRGQRQL